MCILCVCVYVCMRDIEKEREFVCVCLYLCSESVLVGVYVVLFLFCLWILNKLFFSNDGSVFFIGFLSLSITVLVFKVPVAGFFV